MHKAFWYSLFISFFGIILNNTPYHPIFAGQRMWRDPVKQASRKADLSKEIEETIYKTNQALTDYINGEDKFVVQLTDNLEHGSSDADEDNSLADSEQNQGQDAVGGQNSAEDSDSSIPNASNKDKDHKIPEVTDLRIEKTGKTLKLSWSKVKGIKRYHIYRSTDPYFTPSKHNLIGKTKNNEYIDNTAGIVGDPKRNYFYIVRTNRKARKESEDSNRVGEYDLVFEPAVLKPTWKNYKLITIPLENPSYITAKNLMKNLRFESGQILKWDTKLQSWHTWEWNGNKMNPFNENFAISAFGSLSILNSGSKTVVVTFVGDVYSKSQQKIKIVEGMNLLGSAFLKEINLYNATFIEDGAHGAESELYADRVWEWSEDIKDYDYAWFIDGVGPEYDGKWWDGDPWGETKITLKPGKAYWYQRRGESSFIWTNPNPINGGQNDIGNDGDKRRPLKAISDLSIEKTGKTLKLSWSAIKGAKRYKIYRSTDPWFTTSKDTLVKYSKHNSFIDRKKGITGDYEKNYYYVVRAVGKNRVESSDSNRVGEFDYFIKAGDDALIAPPFDDLPFSNAEDFAGFLGIDNGIVVKQNNQPQGIDWLYMSDGHVLAGTNFYTNPGDIIGLRRVRDGGKDIHVTFVGGFPSETRDYVLSRGTNNGISMSLLYRDFTKATSFGNTFLPYAVKVYDGSVVNSELSYIEYKDSKWDGEDFPMKIGYPYYIDLDRPVYWKYQHQIIPGPRWDSPEQKLPSPKELMYEVYEGEEFVLKTEVSDPDTNRENLVFNILYQPEGGMFDTQSLEYHFIPTSDSGYDAVEITVSDGTSQDRLYFRLHFNTAKKKMKIEPTPTLTGMPIDSQVVPTEEEPVNDKDSSDKKQTDHKTDVTPSKAKPTITPWIKISPSVTPMPESDQSDESKPTETPKLKNPLK